MLNSLTAPMAQFTGGVIPSFCPITPSLADLMKPGVEGRLVRRGDDDGAARAAADGVVDHEDDEVARVGREAVRRGGRNLPHVGADQPLDSPAGHGA